MDSTQRMAHWSPSRNHLQSSSVSSHAWHFGPVIVQGSFAHSTPAGLSCSAMFEYAEPRGYLTCPVSRDRSRSCASVRRMLALYVALLALAVAGCSSNSLQQGSPAHHTASPHLRAGAQVAIRPAPHCELAVPGFNTVDAELWARLKLDYERHCYQQAEILVRKRLQRLLTSGRCRIEPD